MPDISLKTKQYIVLMRAIAAAMTLDDHVAALRDDKGDKELTELWDDMMNRAEDFGMSFPEEKDVGEHWSDPMFQESDDDLHALIDDEFWHILAQRLAEAQHAKTCPKPTGEHDEACFEDVQKLGEGWSDKLDKGEMPQFV